MEKERRGRGDYGELTKGLKIGGEIMVTAWGLARRTVTSCNVQLLWLKTENEKEQGNGPGNFFTSTWSSATGCGQLREPRAWLRRLHSKLGEIQKASAGKN